jgi:hypothetical protein
MSRPVCNFTNLNTDIAVSTLLASPSICKQLRFSSNGLSRSIQNTHNVHIESHDPYKIHIMYPFRVMAHTNTHNIHLECHGPYKIHIVYTLRVMADGPWLSRCTLCVFCMDHDSEGVYYVYLHGPWHSRCILCVFCMDHDSQGVQYVSFAWAMTMKVHIMCILYGPWLSMCTLCVFCRVPWPIQNTHSVHLESHGWYKIHIMCSFRVMAHTKYT